MANYTGIWTLHSHIQARAANFWTGLPYTSTNGYLFTWGTNTVNVGQQASNDFINRSTPNQIGNLNNWSSLAVGYDSVLAIKSDGSLWAWGYNLYGELGTSLSGSTAFRSSPVQVGALLDWKMVTTSRSNRGNTLAIKANGALWSWGQNGFGELGANSVVPRSSPVQVGILTTWSTISCQYNSVAGIAGGALFSWGENGFGQLGDVTSVSKSAPVQIGALTNWKSVLGGNFFTVAIKTDGTLWSWGYNNQGQLGDGFAGSTVRRSSPVQIGGSTTWTSIKCGQSHVIGIQTNGSLWGWGLNTSGQLGDTTTANKSLPTQIGNLTTWVTISAHENTSFGITANGSLWGWGSNSNGQLGDGTTVDKSVPTPIAAGTYWASIDAGYNFTAAIQKYIAL